MLNVIARGCPSWVPVKGWRDLGGCWTPPGPSSWWTPLHITAVIAVALLVATAAGLVERTYCPCSGWPHAPWCLRSRKMRAEARS